MDKFYCLAIGILFGLVAAMGFHHCCECCAQSCAPACTTDCKPCVCPVPQVKPIGAAETHE